MATMYERRAAFQPAAHRESASIDISSTFEQEDYEYPVPDWVVIRNGFIDGPKEGPVSSLSDFLKERTVRSCPSSRLAGLSSKVDDEIQEESIQEESTCAGSSDSEEEAVDCDAIATVPKAYGTAFEGPMYVQNAFIHFPPGLDRPQSVLEFIRERKVHSCPASRLLGEGAPGSGIEAAVLEGYVGATPSNRDHSDVDSEEFATTRPCTSASTPPLLLASGASYATRESLFLELDPTLEMWPSTGRADFAANYGLGQASAHLEVRSMEREPVHVLRLEEMLAEPQLGSELLPTVGSQGHRFGRCKPCAFAFTKGCEDGVNCQFCHLCEAGEKKRRRKEKLLYRRDMARTRREAREQRVAIDSYLAAACSSDCI
jgi:hypothetical protein